jgi:hypothetical protein
MSYFIFVNFITFVGTNLLIVAKVHNILFTICCVEICTNMKSPPHYGEIQSMYVKLF